MQYGGEIEDFPKEVVEKMLERQVEQGNKRDISVFERNSWAEKEGTGFDWKDTPEGHYFWHQVVGFKWFDTFFAKYPKKDNNSIVSQFNAQNQR